jgi:hypothetical protein
MYILERTYDLMLMFVLLVFVWYQKQHEHTHTNTQNMAFFKKDEKKKNTS